MKMDAYKDFHTLTCISVIKTCVTGLVLKNKNTILHSSLQKFSSYFHRSVFFVKSGLISNAFYYKHRTQKFVHTIKTCVIGLVLKDKNTQC